jgi:hypothetical protein
MQTLPAGGIVQKRYLVLSEDGAFDVPPVYVIAETVEQALTLYCRKIQSKEDFMRDYVEGNNLDDFIGKLLFTDEERYNAGDNGLTGPTVETIRIRVSAYFSERPDLGKLYLKYLKKKDRSILTESVYEFISERDTSGYEAIEDSTIRTLDSTGSILGRALCLLNNEAL